MKTKSKTKLSILADLWDSRDPFGRMQLVMKHRDALFEYGLITFHEIAMASMMSESALEYVLNRESRPIFHQIDLKKTLNEQEHRREIMTALQAVFI
jgi:hypothetical protein